MDAVLRFFGSMFGSMANLLDSIQFSVGGYSVTWLNLLISFVALSIIIAVFWKGARK